MELDVYIPSVKYAIEYDGEAWHTNERLKIEKHKCKLCRERGIHLIRVREKMPPSFSPIADWMISYGNKKDHVYDKDKIGGIIIEVLRKLSIFNLKLHKQLLLGHCDINVLRDRFEIMESYKIKLKGDTLQSKFPQIAKEWHLTKNGKLKPDMFMCGSEDKVWWKCSKCGYEYEQTIGHRTAKNHPTGCPKCGIRKSALARSKAVNMIDTKTHNIVKTFLSIADASREMNINDSNISMVCKGIRPKAGGYCWEYVKRESEK
ncbi:MAG: hypothetical protein MJ032_04375 [Acidaminococcaceae bacterium]|nr:hypothetical protein [Acidaminococcaceae bacterium]